MKTVDNFYLTKVIGGGAYGTVYLCKIKNEDKIEPDTRSRMRPGKRVACKMIKQKNIKAKIKKYLIQEIEIMMSIKHDNILRFLEAKKTANNIYIFFEFCNGGDLRRFLEAKGGKLDEKVTKVIISQIAKGLNHLNENKAMHRDLKLDNILLNFPSYEENGSVPESYLRDFDPDKEEIEVIIGDLGFARSLGSSTLAESYCGTPLNMAPEIMNGMYYDTKVDIWSFGTMMYELLVGFTPFTGCDPHDLADRVNEGNYGVPKHIKLSLKCLDLLHKCLQFDPKKRINHADLLKHTFLETDEEESEKINLSCSVGPEQKSFFEMPSSGFDINKENAIIFNVKDSCLFNNAYMNTLKKYQQKKAEGEQVPELPEPEELKGDSQKDLPEADLSDNEGSDSHMFDLKQDSVVDEEEKGIEMDANSKVEVMKSTKRVSTKETPKSQELEEEEKLPMVTPTSPKKEEKDNNALIVGDDEELNSAKPASPKKTETDGQQKESLVDKLDKEEPEGGFDESSESDDDYGTMDFTVIDYKNLQPIPEMSESLEKSAAFGPSVSNKNSNIVKKSEHKVEAENGHKVEEEDDLNSSFEIVHYHDVFMVANDYLTDSSRVA